jgi:CheY-like chemotaxis protein
MVPTSGKVFPRSLGLLVPFVIVLIRAFPKMLMVVGGAGVCQKDCDKPQRNRVRFRAPAVVDAECFLLQACRPREKAREHMPVQILLIEDNIADARFMREVLPDVNDSVKLLVASDCVEALAFLRQQGIYVNARRPDLILLNLRRPKVDGHEILAQIETDASLKTIPLIVVTPKLPQQMQARSISNA